MDERVELAVLAARIDAGGEVFEQSVVKPAPCKRTVELAGIDTCDDRLEARGYELARETGGVPVPQRKAGSFGHGGRRCSRYDRTSSRNRSPNATA